ncbi:MAG: MATE family efflux transporter [Ruminococcaceae bacterium]|nr:MATE family efflux transporter [Oscillospiraceae bacterium]
MNKISINTKKLPLAFWNKGFWKAALALALPLALQNMLAASFSLIDTLMVSQLGTIPLSSVNMAGQWSWLFSMVIFGITSGASVFAAQYWGDKNIKGIHKVQGIAIISGLIISLGFTLVALIAPEWVISLFNKDPEVIATGSAYLQYACLSFPAIALTQIFGAILRAVERPMLPTVVTGISAAMNAFINYLLIYSAGMGVKGAAIATAITSWMGPVLIFLVSLIQKNILIAPIREVFAFDRETIAEFFKKASPVIANETMWGLGTTMYNIIFANIGYEEYAAIAIVKTFESFSFCFFIGVCSACCVMVGKSVGSGQIRESIRDSKRFLIIMPVISMLVAVLMISLRMPLISLFNMGENISQYSLDLASKIVIIYSVWAAIRNIPYITVVGIFRSGGDTVTGMIIELGVLWAFSVPMTYIAAEWLGLPFLAVYCTMLLAEDIPKSIIFLLYYRSGKWLRPVTEAGVKGLKEFSE